VLAACGSDEPAPAPAAVEEAIDVTGGTYRGIPLGGAPDDVRAALGPQEPAVEDEPTTPREGESFGPWSIGSGSCGPDLALFLRYERVAFGFDCGELRWVETNEPGVGTREGVAVGHPLAAVEPAYPEALCGTAGGGEYEEYPACSVKVAPKRYVWFGGDPIATIAIGAVPLEGVYREEPFTGEVFELDAGEFVTYPPGEAEPGDKIVCRIDGKEIETFVPPPNTGVSTDPMYVSTKPDGSVRAECGGIHAETAPPGSW
jgi:hypothetical protein